MGRFFPVEVRVFLGLWLLLLVTGRSSLFYDPGTFWHTVLGQQMWERRELVRTDSLTFTYDGTPWLALQWGGELIMAAAHAWGGFDTQLLIAVTALSALYAWLTARLLRTGLNGVLAVALLMLVLGGSTHHFHVRPHLATIAGMALTMSVLVDVENGRRSLRGLWWLVPLFVVWTNIHGGVMAGLATVYLAAAGWCAAFLVKRPMPIANGRQLLTLTAVLAATSAALLVNPYGSQMPRQWLDILRMNLPDLIDEHAPLRWRNAETWMVAALAALYVRLLLSTEWRRWRVTWLLPFVWLVLGFSRVRHAPLFVAVTTVALADVLPLSTVAVWLRERGLMQTSNESSAENPRPFALRWAIPIVVVVMSLVLQGASVPVPVVGRGWAEHSPARWPVGLLDELKRLEASPEANGKIFNALGYGGFLEFHTPRLKPFIDDRCELFGDFLQKYCEAEARLPEKMQEWVDRHQIRYAIVQRGCPFDGYLRRSSRWRLLKEDAAAAIFEMPK